MQKQKCDLDLYVDFLVASQKKFSGAALSKVSPEPIAHDSVSRWLASHKLTPQLLWQASQDMVNSWYEQKTLITRSAIAIYLR